ncbi:hypothetical protein U9M48_014414 [Paspalum notatum var. saurae]|uniref:Uncharacterized protein n=1 Tax=Paspalum notatum var. saurae TaxID=547442 RepID=A0AAQ3T488_PASNO
MEGIGGERARKGDDSFRALTPPPPRGPGPVSPTPHPPPPPPGSGPPHSPPSAAAVLALPASSAGAMDAAAEAMLVRRSKAKKRTQQPQTRDSGGGDRFRALWRDYHELLEDTEAKKNKLASANRRKLALLAEVKFLRRKYRSFAKGGSQQTQCKLKKQVQHIQSPLGSNKATAFAHHGTGTEVPSTSNNPNLELNQDSVMNDEGDGCQGHRARPEEKFDQVGVVDEDLMTTDVKLSVCRDTGNSPASDGKRTVPWQDRLALKA